MIDKKEREALKGYLEDIGANHLGLLELIDLKGKEALDKAYQIASDLGPIEPSKSVGSAEVGSSGPGGVRRGRAAL